MNLFFVENWPRRRPPFRCWSITRLPTVHRLRLADYQNVCTCFRVQRIIFDYHTRSFVFVSIWNIFIQQVRMNTRMSLRCSCRIRKSFFNFYSNPLCSERERIQEGCVKQRTTSLWSMINSHLEFYKNPFYHHVPHSLDPVPTMRYMKLWKSLYCRWNPSMRPQVKNFLRLRINAAS